MEVILLKLMADVDEDDDDDDEDCFVSMHRVT